MGANPSAWRKPRGRNPRGQGERLREDIISAALRLLDELADDQALSLRAVGQDARAAMVRIATRAIVQAAAGLTVLLYLAWASLPGRDFAFVAIGALVGLAAGAWPAIRRRPRGELALSLRRDALIEGLAAGSLRLAGGLVPISITAIAADLHTTNGAVAVGISLTPAVAVGATLWGIRRLRMDQERLPSAGLVLWSFVLVAVGLCGVAVSVNVWWLAASLALIGLPVATNARFRYAAMARHSGQEGTVQRLSNRWSRITSVGGLMAAGASSAFGPWGWRGTALAAAVFFVVLGLAVACVRVGLRAVVAEHARWLAELRRARSSVGGRQAGIEGERGDSAGTGTSRVNRDRLKLRSVRRQLALIVFVVATAQLARTSLEPVLAAGGLASSSALFAGVIVGGVQVVMIPTIDRFAEGSNRSPRQMAFRAVVWALPAALVAPLAAATPWWWLTLPVAACWFAFNEASSGGSGSATRVGLNRSGQIAALYGLLSGYAGNALGAAASGLPWTRNPLGLGGLLLVGGAIAFAISLWTPRQTPTDREPIRTTGRHLGIIIRRVRDREFVTEVSDEHGPGGGLEVGDGDRLSARRPYDDQRASERLPVLDVSIWAGEAWWPYRWLALWAANGGDLADLWPRDRAGFVAGAFHGSIHWHGSEPLPFSIHTIEDGIVIRLELPEPWPLTWYAAKWLDQSELPRWRE